MTTETGKPDIVNDYRKARARLRLGRYERYLVEHIAGRVERLTGKRDAEERGGDNPGDVHEAGGRPVSPGSHAGAGAPANNPPV
jgi:hypothetical protein